MVPGADLVTRVLDKKNEVKGFVYQNAAGRYAYVPVDAKPGDFFHTQATIMDCLPREVLESFCTFG